MLKAGSLTEAFRTYWEDIEKCRSAKAYWSILHVISCIPDICSALQSSDGNSKSAKYKRWCSQFLSDSMLNSDERWVMRNKLLHQGRAATAKPGRYDGFALGQPSESGQIDHRRVDRNILHLDVGELAKEMERAVRDWIKTIEGDPKSEAAKNVERNLPSLVKVSLYSPPPQSVPGITVPPPTSKTS